MTLPVNVDSTYPDDPDRPGRKIHQQHHDALHAFANLWEGIDPDDIGGGAHTHPESEVIDLVDDLAAKETPAGATAKVGTHAALTTGVHGVGASTVESVAGAQAKVDVETAARIAADAAHAADTTAVHGITDTADLVLDDDARLTDARTPSGPAGGVLAGTYPDPSFAADMATQAELNAEAALARNADNLTSGTVADARIAATIARDSEVTAAVSAHEGAADPHAGYLTSAEGNAAYDAIGAAAAAQAASQPLAADLTTIAALDSATAGAMSTDGAGWIRKTYAQLKTALGLVKADVGLGNVDNTSDANKPVSTAQQTAIDVHPADTSAAHAASSVAFTPAGTIAATNVQAAIEEVASEAGGGGISPTVLNANSVLYAVTDDTPAALAMGASTILARLASGDIVAATPAQLRTLLALVIGTDVQAFDAELAAIAGLTSAADRLPYFTGSGAAALATFTAAGRALVDDADAAAQRATMGALSLALLHVRDEKASGTAGGTATAGSYITRALNTVMTNEITAASLASNTLTLPAGTYEVIARAPAHRTQFNKIRIYNVTAAAVLLLGNTTFNASSSSLGVGDAWVTGRFTLGVQSDVRLEHRVSVSTGVNDFGAAASFGDVEVYSEMWLRKVI